MENTNLAFDLHEHRERNGLTPKQVADKFNVPEQEYIRIESGIVRPNPDEEKRYRNLLAQEKLGPPKERKWYHSKAWNWIIPILICSAGFYLLTLTQGSLDGAGISAGKTQPIKGYFVMGGFFCLCYWYFRTPELPFKKGGRQRKLS